MSADECTGVSWRILTDDPVWMAMTTGGDAFGEFVLLYDKCILSARRALKIAGAVCRPSLSSILTVWLTLTQGVMEAGWF